jgi:hypothetical protein
MVAQDEDWLDDTYFDYKKHSEYIVNVTPLIAQLIPFNGTNLSNGNWFDYQYRRLKNGKGFRYGLGINVDEGNRSNLAQFGYLRIGYLRRKQLNKHFHFTRSWDLNIMAEENVRNSLNPVRGKAEFSGLGLSYSLGIEYSFNQHITISTESTLFLGLVPADDSNAKVKLVPPVGLFFHLRL